MRSANCPDGQGAQGFSYVYDRYANRWQQNVTAGSGPQPIATFNNTKNQLDGYSYDADGNLTNDGIHTYTYDAESRIVAVDGGATATYVYDAEGRRVQKTTASGTVGYVYDIAGEQVAEVNSSGGANREEVYAGGKHLATYTNGTTYFNHADWLGTERMRTTVSGSSCETIVSLPFGDGTATTGSCSDASPMHFTGKQHDNESNLDDFDARYYSSEWSRFISADWSADPEPVPYANFTNPQTLNLYAIVADNPDTFADLTGHNPATATSNGCDTETSCAGGPTPIGCDPTTGAGACKAQGEAILASGNTKDLSNGQQDPASKKSRVGQAAKGGGLMGLGLGLIGSAAFGDEPGGIIGALLVASQAVAGSATLVSGTVEVVGAAKNTDVSKAQALESMGNLPGLAVTAASGGNLKAGKVAATISDAATLATNPREAMRNVATAVDAGRTVANVGKLARSSTPQSWGDNISSAFKLALHPPFL